MGMDDNIMVIKRDTLFQNGHFEGFKPHSETDYLNTILNNYNFMLRRDAEEDPTFQQPVSYCVIVNPEIKKIFVFQRAEKDEHYNEKRLQGKYSWGIGGHIDEPDKEGNPLHNALKRELLEEADIKIDKIPEILGYINFEGTPVDAVHFGILYIVETDLDELNPPDPEIAHGKFMTLEEIDNLDLDEEQIEWWSRIALDPLRKYFNDFKL